MHFWLSLNKALNLNVVKKSAINTLDCEQLNWHVTVYWNNPEKQIVARFCDKSILLFHFFDSHNKAQKSQISRQAMCSVGLFQVRDLKLLEFLGIIRILNSIAAQSSQNNFPIQLTFRDSQYFRIFHSDFREEAFFSNTAFIYMLCPLIIVTYFREATKICLYRKFDFRAEISHYFREVLNWLVEP